LTQDSNNRQVTGDSCVTQAIHKGPSKTQQTKPKGKEKKKETKEKNQVDDEFQCINTEGKAPFPMTVITCRTRKRQGCKQRAMLNREEKTELTTQSNLST